MNNKYSNYEDVKLIVDVIDGFLVPGQEKYLFDKVKALPDSAVIVEIGSFKGRSSASMGYACLASNKRIYCIDTWNSQTWEGNSSDCQESDFFEIWQKNTSLDGVSEHLTPLRGYSHDILSQWYEIVGQQEIDFIFIDGSHEYKNVLKDFELCLPLVKEGGWIAFHDVTPEWEGSERVWNEIAKNYLTNHEYCSTIACGQKIFSFNTEKSEQTLVRNLIQPGMTVFDIGANIGDYSILFSKLVGKSGKVYAFEPTLTTFSKLNERIEKYQCKNVSLFQIAIFSQEGQVEINEFPEDYSGWNSIGKPKMLDPQQNYEKYVEIIRTESVKSLTIDSFCRNNGIEKIDYLKIDVEGAESHVLLGANELLKEKKIRFIQFEISENMLKGLNLQAKDVFDILINNGYECHQIQDDGEIGKEVFVSNSFYENYIAFPSLPAPFSGIIERLQSNLQITTANLELSQSELQTNIAELDHSRSELQQLESKFQQLECIIAGMESSKFWKIRQAWFKLKNFLASN